MNSHTHPKHNIEQPCFFIKLIKFILITAGAVSITGLLLLAVLFYNAKSVLEIDNKPDKADYIVLLGGNAERAIYGAELYNEGFAPYCLISVPERQYSRPLAAAGIPQLSQDKKYTMVLKHYGVPQDALRYFGNGSISTYEEGLELKKIFKDKPVKLLVVTSTYHARRAETILKTILPHAQLKVVSNPEDRIPEQWWTDRFIALQVILEATKTLYFLSGGGFTATQPDDMQPPATVS